MLSFFLFLSGDQVEHAHDNPLDEITLDECNTTASMTLDEVPSEKHATPKKMNLEIDKEHEVKCEFENDAQVEGKKTKKKELKKEKVKRKNIKRIFYSNVMCLCLFMQMTIYILWYESGSTDLSTLGHVFVLCVFMHAHVKLTNTLISSLISDNNQQLITFSEMEKNDEKETEMEKGKEKKEKKTKKKVKESEDPQKTNKTTKQERKSNISVQFIINTSVLCMIYMLCVRRNEHCLTLLT